MSIPELPKVGLRRMAAMIFHMCITTVLLLVVYAIAPITDRPHQSILVRLTIGVMIFIAVLVWQIKAITNHQYPELRAFTALAILLPLFIFVFAWLYLNSSISEPEMFGHPLNRVSAFYFTVTTFSTVGYGDITAKTSAGQVLATIQMIADLVFIAVGVSSILKVGQRRSEIVRGDSGPAPLPRDSA